MRTSPRFLHISGLQEHTLTQCAPAALHSQPRPSRLTLAHFPLQLHLTLSYHTDHVLYTNQNMESNKNLLAQLDSLTFLHHQFPLTTSSHLSGTPCFDLAMRRIQSEAKAIRASSQFHEHAHKSGLCHFKQHLSSRALDR